MQPNIASAETNQYFHFHSGITEYVRAILSNSTSRLSQPIVTTAIYATYIKMSDKERGSLLQSKYRIREYQCIDTIQSTLHKHGKMLLHTF